MSEGLIENKTAVGQVVERDIGGESVMCEAAGEYTLPDYQPEIRKLLHIRAAVLPTGKYMGGSKAEFAGTVAHTILYADAEGKLASVTLNTDYDFSLPLPDGENYTAVVDTMAEGTTCRLAGPRKLSLRTRLRSMVHLLREESIAPEIRGMGSEADEATLEKWEENRESMQLACASSGEFPLSSTVKLEIPATDAHTVWAGGNLLISECRPQDGGCLCRGEAWVRCLLVEGDASPIAVREKIPFEQFVAVPDAGDKASFLAYGRLLMADVSLAPGEGEENGSLTFDVSAEIDACAVATRPCNPVKDLYSTAYDMTCHYRMLPVTRSLGVAMGNYTVSGNRPRTECDAENATAVVDADGRMEIKEVTVEHGRAVVSGKLLVQVIFSECGEGADGAPTLSCAEIVTPFRVESELRLTPGTRPQFACHGELVSVRARVEPHHLTFDAEIALSLRAYESEELRVLESAEPDRSVPVDHAGNRVYVVYPKAEDTLFSVAGRYHKSRATVAAQNQLAPDACALSHLTHSLDGVHHLLITDEQ